MAAAVHSHAVPVLVSDAGAPVLDNLQDLLRRKREIEKNKSKYHLTEADCNLILTNANEYSFTDGQVIMEDGHENSSVYRIKSGSVLLSKNGYSFCELSQGYFLGETLFLNKTHDIIEASLIAKGPVTLVEVNLSFVKKLFEVDRVLALKFYRNLASKLSSIFFAVSGNLLSPCVAKMYQESAAAASASASSIEKGSDSPASLHNSPSASSLSSSGSASSGSSSDGRRLSHSSSNSSTSSVGSMSPARTMIHCPNVPQASVEVANRRRRMSKRIAHTPFKIYILETDGKGIRTARLKNKKIKLITEAFGFKHKKTINFNKIKNIVRTSTTSITIIYDPLKAKTLFFRNTAELDEFYGLTNSLVENNSKSNLRSTPGTPLSQASNRPSPLKNSIDNHFLPLDARDDDEQRAVDKEVIIGLATRLELRKGDLLVEEGDLYQRIYTIVKGTCETLSGDRVISTIKEGEVFGEASMLHLRPAPVSIRISSATASVLIIPAYKLQDLINSNPVLAVRLYKKMAALVDKKIDRALATKRQLTTELCGAEYAKMVPERLNL